MRTLLKNARLAVPVALVLLFAVLYTMGCSKKSQQPEQNNEVQPPVENVTAQPQPAAPQTQIPPVNDVKPVAAKTLYFKELDEDEQIEAERLMAYIKPGQRIGALPMTGYSMMVTTCRQIIQRWPDSSYAYKAKQFLISLPDNEKQTYKITASEMDLSMYEKPRTGTQPFNMKE
jgi:hypothetical protein